MDRKEWLEWRKKGVTGTDVGQIIGISPYGTAADVWDDKHGLKIDIDKPVFQRGRILEPIVLDMWSKDKERDFVMGEPLIHPQFDHRRGTPDALSGFEVLEVKCWNSFAYRKIKKSENQTAALPLTIHAQGAWYMGLTGLKKVRYIIFSPELWEYIEIVCPFDEGFYDMLALEADKFWKNIVNGDRPEASAPAEFPGDDKDIPILALTDKDLAWKQGIADYRAAKEVSEMAEEALKTAKAEIGVLMGQNLKARGFGASISYKTQMRTTFDSKTFKVDHPELAKKYVKTSESRPLRVTEL